MSDRLLQLSNNHQAKTPVNLYLYSREIHGLFIGVDYFPIYDDVIDSNLILE